MKNFDKLMGNVMKGIKAYEKEVRNMSDRELYFHVFNGDNPRDYASKLLKERGIEEFYPCPQCQSQGCHYCSNTGEIPTFS